MNAISPISTRSSAPALMPNNLTEAMSLATMMSQSKLVPAALQKSPADCLLVIEQAMRWGMSPFAVAQEVSVIQGKMMFSGKIVAAAIHTAPGVLKGRLKYNYTGEGAGLGVLVSGFMQGEDEARFVEVSLSSAKTNNQWWVKTPEQMLSYHGARVWARRHAPEVMLGVYAPEEFDGVTIEAAPQPVQRTQSPRLSSPTINQALGGDDIPDFDAPPPPPAKSPLEKATEWLQAINTRLAAVTDQDSYNEVMHTPKLRPGLQAIQRDFPDLYVTYEEARAGAMERIVPKHEANYFEAEQSDETAA